VASAPAARLQRRASRHRTSSAEQQQSAAATAARRARPRRTAGPKVQQRDDRAEQPATPAGTADPGMLQTRKFAIFL
jgi:hypothetical protein